jgi:penicillin-binding protein 1A
MNVAKRIFPILIALAISSVIAILAAGMGAYYYLAPGLPSADTIRDVKLQIPLRIYTRDGRLIEQFGERRRDPVPFAEIPPQVANAFLAAEDDRFYEHPGFDYQGIARAAFNLLLTGSRAQGGSTITQQLAREYFLTRDRTFVRKGRELILALQIEQEFSKDEILALYLNKIFLGQRAYGVGAAAQVYFGKNLSQLSTAEAATLAGLPKAPSTLNPVTNPARAVERRTYVLRRMWELNDIDKETYEAALTEPMMSRLHGSKIELEAPYVAAMASKDLIRRFGQEEAYTGGYKVVTTVDSRLQIAAEKALRKTLLEYDQRHGYRGVVDQLDLYSLAPSLQPGNGAAGEDPAREAAANEELQILLNDYPVYRELELAVVIGLNPDNSADVFVHNYGRARLSWENLKRSPYIDERRVGNAPQQVSEIVKPGSIIRVIRDDLVIPERNAAEGKTAQLWRLAQMPQVQGAIVSLDPYDGAISSLSGGFDYATSKFNRASQARRQPGSSIKPFIYSAALEHGFTAATIVKDAPIVVNDSNLEAIWRPENYSGKFYGDTRLREGLVRSMNLVSLQTLRRVGLGNAIEHLSRFGFPDDGLPRDLTLALGSGAISMLDLAGGYAGLAAGGRYLRPYVIERIEDVNGNVVYQADPTVACDACKDIWFDGREKRQLEIDEFGLGTGVSNDVPPELIEIQEGESWFAAGSSTLPPVDSEVPYYRDTAQMIAEAANWRPTAAETPDFFNNTNVAPRIVAQSNAYIIYDMMRDVVSRGTGRAIRELGRNDLAGKTGTTNEGKDTWFAGFNQEIAATVWVGFDSPSLSLGRTETGGKTALPMWKYFMQDAVANQPEAPLEQPADIVTVRISAKTGKLARTGEPDSRFEIFTAGTEPTQQAIGTLPMDVENTNDDNLDAGDIF